jgi:hypothetical protein
VLAGNGLLAEAGLVRDAGRLEVSEVPPGVDDRRLAAAAAAAQPAQGSP